MNVTAKRLVPRAARQVLRACRFHFGLDSCARRRLLSEVEPKSAILSLAGWEPATGGEGAIIRLLVKGFEHPVALRLGTSDFEVFVHVLMEDQYAIPLLADAEFIIDAGANIGLASLYLLHRYPHATVVAIEPDRENFAIAQENLAPYADRCHVVCAGLWSADGELAIRRGQFRDGRHWATQTVPQESTADELIRACTIESIVHQFGFPHIDFLKIDVEGAERTIFAEGDVSFLSKTRLCAVECHDAEATAAVLAAARQYGFQLSHRGELTVAYRNGDFQR